MTIISFAPTQDAYIAQFYPTQNFGSVPFLYVSRYKQVGDIYRSLIQFDLCSLGCNFIPPDSCIKDADLKLHVYRNEVASGSIDINVFRVLQSWAENTVTWNNQPIVSSSPDGTEPIAAGFFGTVKIDITHLVRGWYSGRIVNNGLLLTGNETTNDLVGFYSREFPDTSLWPKLTIRYHRHNCKECDIDCDQEH